MPARLLVLSLCVLPACRPERPLSLVPISGGTRQERAIVREELEAFAQAVGPDRVEVRQIEIVEQVGYGDRMAGSYSRSGIELDAGSPGLASTVRHELCHALDHAEGLTVGPDPLLDELAAGLFQEDPSLAELWHDYYKTARKQRAEALATFCELGPVALDSLRQPCPGQSPLLQEVAEWMLDRVYLDYTPMSPLELDPSGAVTMDAWVEGPQPDISATARAGVGVVEAQADWSDWGRGLDLYTGQTFSPAPDGEPDLQRLPWLGGFAVHVGAGWSKGPAAAFGSMQTHHLRAPPRLLVYDPEEQGWRPVLDSCDVQPDLFTADGELWRSWTEGPMLRWKPVLP
jgi:hypothetical protein